jgi:hypothetical protein
MTDRTRVTENLSPDGIPELEPEPEAEQRYVAFGIKEPSAAGAAMRSGSPSPP